MARDRESRNHRVLRHARTESAVSRRDTVQRGRFSVSDETPFAGSLLIRYIRVPLGLWTIGCLALFFYPIAEAQNREEIARLKATETAAGEQTIRDGGFGGPAR